MRINFLLKYFLALFKEYIFIFLTATIFLITPFSKTFAVENVFTINNVIIKGTIDLNFSREKYIEEAFSDSFKILMDKILLSKDLKKIKNIQLKEIKNLINSFQILEEKYSKDEYRVKVKIFYNESRIKKFLGKKYISFSQPENIKAVFFPVLFINGEIKNFDENFVYKNWENVEIENKLIKFILPLEDLEDISKIIQVKNKIEELNVDELVNKYDVKNYVFTLMDYQNSKLSIHLKISMNGNLIKKNISYNLKNLNNELEQNQILKDLKIKIIDIWKEENLIDILMPLSIRLKFQHEDLNDLHNLKNIFYKISIIDHYTLNELDINNSFFQIYYYGNPKKLRSELLKFGYILNSDQGYWQLYKNE